MRISRRGTGPPSTRSNRFASLDSRRGRSQPANKANGRRVHGANPGCASTGNLAAGGSAIPAVCPAGRRPDTGCGLRHRGMFLPAGGAFPKATVLGVDIIGQHLDLARSRYANLAPRLAFEHQSIYELQAADRTFDLTVCRHVIHSIPYPDRVIAELARGRRGVFRSDDRERPRSPRIRSLAGSGGKRARGTCGRCHGVELFESHARFQQIARDAP